MSSSRVEAYVRQHCFTTGTAPGGLRFGAELELLAVDASSRRIAPIESAAAEGSLAVARSAATRLGWTECGSTKGVPRFVAAHGGALSFEPGGQLEYASSVHGSLDELLRELDVVDAVLRDEAAVCGIDLLALGVDPENDAGDAPLQLQAERYRRMAAHFAGIGPDGARMMRQTASLQLCLGGVDGAARFRLANALAPWMVALFANSSRYAGAPTGCASYRADSWRRVDPQRTGILHGTDPVREYAAFAMRAPAFLVGPEGAPVLPLASLDRSRATDVVLATHLSTLFPEVRPRGYLELRSMDAMEAEHRAAAVVFAVGLLADPASAARAAEVAAEPDAALLVAAGRAALDDVVLAAGARDLVDVALAGCERLGARVVGAAVLERARDTFTALLSRNRREHPALARR
jgi:glutamate--cysteine ligase